MFPFMARIRSSLFGHRREGLREQRASQSHSPEPGPGGWAGRARGRCHWTGPARRASRTPVTYGAHAWRESVPPQGSLGAVSRAAWFALFIRCLTPPRDCESVQSGEGQTGKGGEPPRLVLPGPREPSREHTLDGALGDQGGPGHPEAGRSRAHSGNQPPNPCTFFVP